MLYTQLVPWRFGLLTLHTISLCCYYQVKFEAIQVTLPAKFGRDLYGERHYTTDADINEMYREAAYRLDVVLWWGYVCLLCDYVGLMAALTLDWPRVTLFHLWSHAVGSVWTIWAQLDGWQFEAMEWQFVLCVLLPTSIEVFVGSLQLKKYLDEKMRPRADASAGPPSLRTLAMLRFLLALIGVVIFLAGLFVMAPHAHKDRIKHDRDNDKWETPAQALSFGFWLGLAIMMVGLIFMGVAVYVHRSWMANHPELPDPSSLPPRRRRESSFKAPRLPKMLRRKDKKEEGSDDDDVPLLLDRRSDDDADDDDQGVEMTDRKPEAKAPDSDISDSEDEAKESTPLNRDDGPRRRAARRRGDDDSSISS